jgi:DNA-binding NarL/FixJ family response regulator
VRVLIADDHPLFREALRLQVGRILPPDCGFAEVASYADVRKLVDGGGDHFDLAFVDYQMPGGGTSDQLGAVVDAMEGTPVILIYGAAAPDEVVRAVRAGVKGFIAKTMGPELMEAVIRVVIAGGTYLPADVLQGQAAVEAPPAPMPPEGLTAREQEVLTQMASGASNKEIGRTLNLAEVTVKLHVRQILRKIGAKNRSEAAVIATRSGWV